MNFQLGKTHAKRRAIVVPNVSKSRSLKKQLVRFGEKVELFGRTIKSQILTAPVGGNVLRNNAIKCSDLNLNFLESFPDRP